MESTKKTILSTNSQASTVTLGVISTRHKQLKKRPDCQATHPIHRGVARVALLDGGSGVHKGMDRFCITFHVHKRERFSFTKSKYISSVHHTNISHFKILDTALKFYWSKIFISWLHSSFSSIDNIGNIDIRGFTTWKKSSGKLLPPVGIEPRQPLIPSPTLSFLH